MTGENEITKGDLKDLLILSHQADKAMEKGIPIPSPCVGVCQINASTRFCLGCWRTLKEVAHWSRYSNGEKENLMQELIERRDRLSSGKRRATRRSRRLKQS